MSPGPLVTAAVLFVASVVDDADGVPPEARALARHNSLQVARHPGPRVENLDLLTTDAEDVVEAPGPAPHYPKLLTRLPDPDLVVHGADVPRGRPLDHPDTGPDVTDLDTGQAARGGRQGLGNHWLMVEDAAKINRGRPLIGPEARVAV